MAIEAGQQAPDFERSDQNGDKVKLSDLRGDSAVALVFYPFSFTGGCESELCSLRDERSVFEDAGVKVVAVSCDSVFVHKRWSEDQGFGYSLVSDFWPHGEISRAYGVFNEDVGCATRSTFVIGTDGTIVDAFETPDLGTLRTQSRYEEALAKL